MAREVRHPIFARLFDKGIRQAEQAGANEHRDELLAGLSGRVVEVGAGNGINFKRYPPEVSEVVAVEPEDFLRRKAEEEAARVQLNVSVVDGLADRLPLEDGSVDAAVCSLVLCSVPDQERALAELRRVIRPGGELRFYEHVLAHDPKVLRWQRRVARAWPYFSGGCHVDRDTPAAIERAGFEMERCRRFPFKPMALAVPVEPHVIGSARRA